MCSRAVVIVHVRKEHMAQVPLAKDDTWSRHSRRIEPISRSGIDMSGRRPLIKGYFAVLRLIVDAVMSSACLMRVMTPVGPDVVR